MSKRTENRIKRNAAIYTRYKELYDKERVRIDDCIKKLCEEFFLTEPTIQKAIRDHSETIVKK